jgi:hypothetical protein
VSAVSELERLSALVDTIYRGATEPQRWPEIVADATGWLESPKGMLYTPLNGPEQGGIYFQHGLPDFFLELYKSRYQSVDMWTEQVVRLDKFKEGNVILGTDLVPHDTLINSRWYDECLRHGDISHLLTSVVFEVKPPGLPSCDMPTACSFYRGADDDEYTEADRRKLALLLPHLSRALGVMSRLRMSDLKVAASLSSLDALPMALMLMSVGGEVLFCNCAATAMLAGTDVLRIDRSVRRHGLGRLAAKLPRIERAIARSLASAQRVDDVAHFSSLIEVPGEPGEGDWSIQLSRVSPGSPLTADGCTPEVIVFLNNLQRPLDLAPEVLWQHLRADARRGAPGDRRDGRGLVAGRRAPRRRRSQHRQEPPEAGLCEDGRDQPRRPGAARHGAGDDALTSPSMRRVASSDRVMTAARRGNEHPASIGARSAACSRALLSSSTPTLFKDPMRQPSAIRPSLRAILSVLATIGLAGVTPGAFAQYEATAYIPNGSVAGHTTTPGDVSYTHADGSGSSAVVTFTTQPGGVGELRDDDVSIRSGQAVMSGGGIMTYRFQVAAQPFTTVCRSTSRGSIRRRRPRPRRAMAPSPAFSCRRSTRASPSIRPSSPTSRASAARRSACSTRPSTTPPTRRPSPMLPTWRALSKERSTC